MSEKFSLIYEPRNTYAETGYHTTLTIYKESILKEGFRPSNKEDDWLGEGVYFWDNIENAKWWKRKGDVIPRCIFVCRLNCELENYLDLDIEMDKLDTFSKRYINEMAKRYGKKPNFKNHNQVKKFFCDTYCSQNNINILSFTFKHDIINKAGFVTGFIGRRQICVRKIDCISVVDIKE